MRVAAWCSSSDVIRAQDQDDVRHLGQPPGDGEAAEEQQEEDVVVQTGLDRREADPAEVAPSEHARLSELGPGVGTAGGREAHLQEEDRLGVRVRGGV